MKWIYVAIFTWIIVGNSFGQSWYLNDFEIELKKNSHLTISLEDKVLTEITSIDFNHFPSNEIEFTGIGTNSVQFNINTSNEYGPQQVSLTIQPVGNGLHFYAKADWARFTAIKMKDFGEQYFGMVENLFPENKRSPNLRGTVFDLEVKGKKYHEWAANAYSAFYMTNRGYASFFDSFARGTYHFAINGETKIFHETNELNWYLFTGEDGDEILEAYYNIIGKPKYVPLWACGPIIWRDHNENKDEILKDIEKFTELEIPVTGWFVDRPYGKGESGWTKMGFNEDFSNPEAWIKTINDDYGIKFMTWIAPAVFGEVEFPGMFPGYYGYFDLTNPESVEQFRENLTKKQYEHGVVGHKMDRGDEEFPVNEFWHEPTPKSERRNKYVYLYSKVVDSIITGYHGKENFTFARAAYHRSQPYLGAIWGGDVGEPWWNFANNIANAIRCGFMGFPMWGTDVGSYGNEPSGRIPEFKYIRWLQWGVWNGFYEIKIDNVGGRGEDRPPWKYPESLQHAFRKANEERMELLPYIYSLLNTSYKNGVLMKPMAYVFPKDTATYEMWSQYMFGDAFLVAPVYDSTNVRTVYLPEGKWLNYYNQNEKLTGPVNITVNAPMDYIPVYLKRNSLFVKGSVYDGNASIWNENISNQYIDIYAIPGEKGDHCRFTLVDIKDNDKEKQITLYYENDFVVVESEPVQYQGSIRVFMEEKPVEIRYNNKRVKKADYNPETNYVNIPYRQDEAFTIQIKLHKK